MNFNCIFLTWDYPIQRAISFEVAFSHARHDGANLKVIVEGIETAPDGLTIDPEHGHIHYANMANSATNSGFISQVNIDGKDDMIIVP